MKLPHYTDILLKDSSDEELDPLERFLFYHEPDDDHNCSDFRDDLEKLLSYIAQLPTLCDCGRELSRGYCHVCDNDE